MPRVFFSHYHGDHMGEIYRILLNVPLWMGETTREVAQVLHTGAFRAHGSRGKGLNKAMQRYVGQVDWVVCEGTTLSRPAEKLLTERELGQLAQQIMERYRYVFALCSSTNIDRIAMLHRANPQGRLTICDRYQKEVLKIIQRRHGVKNALYRFDLMWWPYSKSFQSRLWKYANHQGFLMFVRPTMRFRNIMEHYRENSVILYSQWNGYREAPYAEPRIQRFLEGFPVIPLHTTAAMPIRPPCRRFADW